MHDEEKIIADLEARKLDLHQRSHLLIYMRTDIDEPLTKEGLKKHDQINLQYEQVQNEIKRIRTEQNRRKLKSEPISRNIFTDMFHFIASMKFKPKTRMQIAKFLLKRCDAELITRDDALELGANYINHCLQAGYIQVYKYGKTSKYKFTEAGLKYYEKVKQLNG